MTPQVYDGHVKPPSENSEGTIFHKQRNIKGNGARLFVTNDSADRASADLSADNGRRSGMRGVSLASRRKSCP
jgi:hypothetical protein